MIFLIKVSLTQSRKFGNFRKLLIILRKTKEIPWTLKTMKKMKHPQTIENTIRNAYSQRNCEKLVTLTYKLLIVCRKGLQRLQKYCNKILDTYTSKEQQRLQGCPGSFPGSVHSSKNPKFLIIQFRKEQPGVEVELMKIGLKRKEGKIPICWIFDAYYRFS